MPRPLLGVDAEVEGLVAVSTSGNVKVDLREWKVLIRMRNNVTVKVSIWYTSVYQIGSYLVSDTWSWVELTSFYR